MNKIAISSAIGVGAALILWGIYVGAPHVGLRLSSESLLVLAAILAFASTITMLSFAALSKPEKKKAPSKKTLHELTTEDFAHFPKSGLKIVLRPDDMFEEIIRNPDSYNDKDVFFIFKKGKGKAEFNPVTIKKILQSLKDIQGFLHILLVDEHDEFVGYIPAFWARKELTGGNAESLIAKYIIEVMAEPYGKSLRLREINGLSIEDSIFDHETLADALKRTAGGFNGFVVFRNKSLRKPVGVIWKEDLVRLNVATE